MGTSSDQALTGIFGRTLAAVPSLPSVPYEGRSAYLRWAPKVLLALAALTLLTRWNHSVQFATLFVLLSFVHTRWLAWHFTVADDGITLEFPFGRRVFIAKERMTIRIEMVGAIALLGRHRRFGYPLLDRILYEPGHGDALWRVFSQRGYKVVGP